LENKEPKAEQLSKYIHKSEGTSERGIEREREKRAENENKTNTHSDALECTH